MYRRNKGSLRLETANHVYVITRTGPLVCLHDESENPSGWKFLGVVLPREPLARKLTTPSG